MQIISNIKLEPVIKFDLDYFFEVTGNNIDFNQYYKNNSWSTYYKKGLESIGINNIEFMNENSSFVSINQFDDNNLKKLIRWDLNKRFEPEFADYIL